MYFENKCPDCGYIIHDTEMDICPCCGFNMKEFKEIQKLHIENGILMDIGECNANNIILPNTVTCLAGAFIGCTGLTSITIPNSVTSIGWMAFSGCTSLRSITIPNSVTSIGQEAFSDCESLTSITIPNSVTSIGESAFWNCTSLTSITVDPNNKKYDSRDNCNAIIETITNTLIAGCKNSVIPNSVTYIGNCVFDGCESLTSITIPNSVTSIGQEAFRGCINLVSISISNTVTRIGKCAFFGCTSLRSITIPNSVTSIGQEAFADCKSLTSIVVDPNNKKYDSRENCNAIIETTTNTLVFGCKNTIIPNSVTSIGEGSFISCTSLTSVTIPNSVTSIGNSAFWYCLSLTSITIPNSVTSIGRMAFDWIRCNITYQGTIAQWNSISKANDWNDGFTHSIICTDGTIKP